MNNPLIKQSKNLINDDLLEKVILQNDLGGLSPIEKVQHIKNVCDSLGLNSLTKPIQLHKFQGREVMYMSKDGTEQLRNLHNVSIIKLETEFLKNDLYLVKAYATRPGGRQDCSTSAQSIAGLKNDALCNALKKCETQAKRRVTLSICGLGMLDESELENLPKDISHAVEDFPINKLPNEDFHLMVEELIEKIHQCKSMEELKDVYIEIVKNQSLKGNKEVMKLIIEAKDAKKNELSHNQFLDELNATNDEVNDAQSITKSE